MKKLLIIYGTISGILVIVFLSFFIKYGRREVLTSEYPPDRDYYIKIYQTGYLKEYEYRCVCILYGPNGEISREYFNAMSTDQIEKRNMDNSVIVEWEDDFVTVSVKDPEYGGISRMFYIDGRISLTNRHWGAGF